MGAPSPPTTGAITDAATAGTGQQFNYNVGAQYGSMPNVESVTGGTRYVQTGTGPNGAPQYTAYTSLSPSQQALYNYYTGAQGKAGAAANALLAGSPYATTSPSQYIGDMTSGTLGEMMNTWQKGTQPFFDTQQEQLDNTLRNQGVQPGTKAYDVAMRNLQTNQGLAIAQTSAGFEPQAFTQASQLYQMPLSMAESAATFGQPTIPQTPATPSLQPPNVAAMLSAEIPAFMQPYSAAYQQYGNLMNGLFGLGSAGLTGLTQLSDLRLKRNVELIGHLANGLAVYAFNFVGQTKRQIGVLAQQVLGIRPDCVVTLPDGYLAVRYDLLLEEPSHGDL